MLALLCPLLQIDSQFTPPLNIRAKTIAMTLIPSNTLAASAALLVFAACMLLELIMPRRQADQGLAWRWCNNFGLGLLTWYLSAGASIHVLITLTRWTSLNEVGLLRALNTGPICGFFVFLVCSELLSYWIHRAYHQFSWLWPIHAVHHSDTNVDVSTSYRHHPFEPILHLPFTASLALIMGIPTEVAVSYRLFDITARVFSHSNIRIPAIVERYLSYLILTPDFHRIHHCAEQKFANSNFGSLLPWFDYLFGTAKKRNFNLHGTIELGLHFLRRPRDTRLDQLLIQPLPVYIEALKSSTTSTGKDN